MAEATPSSTTSRRGEFKIQQKISSSSKNLSSIVDRSMNPNDVIIKRRFDEGSNPLFQRDDITVNCESKRKKIIERPTSNRESPTDSSSSPKPRTSKRPPIKHRTPEKIPYFNDEKRERSRLRRIYEPSKKRRSSSHSVRRNRHRSTTSPQYESFSSTQSRHRRKSSSYERRRKRSLSREKHSTHRARERYRYGISRSPTPSYRKHRRSGSHSMKRQTDCHRSPTPSKSRSTTEIPPQPQFINISVPGPADYGYALPTPWPPQFGWGGPPIRGPPCYAPYPLPIPPTPIGVYQVCLPYRIPPSGARFFRPPRGLRRHRMQRTQQP